MRFFEQQARARRYTVRLVLLYIGFLLLTVYLLTWVSSWFFPRGADHARYYFLVAGAFALVLLGASLYRLRELSQGGGHLVAQALGGQLVQDGQATLAERRLLNVVDEMALAATVRRPAVYVLPDSSINAFAAGMRRDDAVIGITRGAIEQLDRSELQAVVAHEFSHILNGDMRLNMRLTGWLFGLQMIAVLGKYLLTDSSGNRAWRRSGGASANGVSSGLVLVVVGLACAVFGWLGALFAGWIQAAISRQREYLADASAVQFTRQTEGMAGALYKIAISPQRRLHTVHAREYAHFMFGSVELPHVFEGLSATHPRIIERIRRVSPIRAREWEAELEVAQKWSDRRPSQGVFAFAQGRQEREEQKWALAGYEAQWHDQQSQFDAMRQAIARRCPGHATRQAALRQTAPGIWLSLAANGGRADLLLQSMLAPEGWRPAAAADGVGSILCQQLLRRPLPEVCYLDLLEYMLPFAVAEQSPAALAAAAEKAYRANQQARVVQHGVWHLLHSYLDIEPESATRLMDAGADTLMGAPADMSADATVHMVRELIRLQKEAEDSGGMVDLASFQQVQAALQQATRLPLPQRQQLLAHCERLWPRWSDRVAADALRHVLAVSLPVE